LNVNVVPNDVHVGRKQRIERCEASRFFRGPTGAIETARLDRRMASRRFVPALVLLVLLGISACGSSSDSTSRTSEELSSGRVDVGGYQLDWMCRGVGSPTVVAEAGYDSAGTDTWFDLLGPVSKISRICTYDRAGIGTSDTRPDGLHVTSMLQAEELHRLLEGAGIEPPYVVVGHSYGGFVSRLFAAKYAPETAGLVLIDSSHEDEIEPYRRYYGDSPEGDWVDGGDHIDIDATAAALRRTARDFGDLPLAVVKAGRYEDVLTVRLWNRTQAHRHLVLELAVRASSRQSLRDG